MPQSSPPVILIASSLVAVTFQAWAQPTSEALAPVDGYHQTDAFMVQLAPSAQNLSLPPGALLRLSGFVTYQPDGTLFDAGDSGLVDASASGLTLRQADRLNHVYVFQMGQTGAASCSAAGVAAPCLMLRLPQLAAERQLDLDEFREGLSGTVTAQVLVPSTLAAPALGPSWPSPPPSSLPSLGPSPPVRPPRQGTSWLWIGALAVSAAGFALSLGVLGMAVRRRHTPDVLARVLEAQRDLHRRLGGDSSRARLKAVVDDLVTEARALVALDRKLLEAVTQAKPDQLERRLAYLRHTAQELAQRGGEQAGQVEMDEAGRIVDQQLHRCRQWEMQRWRSAARLERIATRLEALKAELHAPDLGATAGHDRLLALLQEELDLARAGEAETQQLLRGEEPPRTPQADA